MVLLSERAQDSTADREKLGHGEYSRLVQAL